MPICSHLYGQVPDACQVLPTLSELKVMNMIKRQPWALKVCMVIRGYTRYTGCYNTGVKGSAPERGTEEMEGSRRDFCLQKQRDGFMAEVLAQKGLGGWLGFLEA